MEFEIPQNDEEKEVGYGGSMSFDIGEDAFDISASELKKKCSSVLNQVAATPFLLYDVPSNYGWLFLSARNGMLSESVSKIAKTLSTSDYSNLTSETTRKYRSVIKMVAYLLQTVDVTSLVVRGVYDLLKVPIDAIFSSTDFFFLECLRKVAQNGMKQTDNKTVNTIFLKLTALNHVDAIVTNVLQNLSEDSDISSIDIILKDNDTVVQKLLRQIAVVDLTNGKLQKNIATVLPKLPNLVPESVNKLPSLLHALLDQQEHVLRNGVIECYGVILLTSPNDKLFDCLFDRFYDVNSFVRIKVLQTWGSLVEHRAVPLDRFNNIVEKVVERLNDKSTPVRKNAISLLESMLEFNPYSVILRRDMFESKLQETAEMLKNTTDKMSEDSDDDNDVEDKELNVPTEKIIQLFEGTGFQHIADTELLETKKQEVLKNFVEWVKNSIEFIDSFDNAISIVENILESTTVLDLKEAIKFFGTICQHKIAKGATAMKKTLELLFSKEVDVQNVIVDSVVKSLCDESPQSKINNLLLMANGSNIGEDLCMKKLTGLLINKKVIAANEVDYLLAYMAGKLPGGADLEAITAMTLLSYIASNKPKMITEKIPLITSICFVKNCTANYVYHGALILKALYESEEDIPKLAMNDPIVKELVDVLDAKYPTNTWVPVMHTVLDLLYKAVENPNEAAREIVRHKLRDVQERNGLNEIVRLIGTVGGVARKQGEMYDAMKEGVVEEVEKKKGKKGKKINDVCESKMNEVVGEVLEDGLLGEFVKITDAYVTDIIAQRYSEDIYLTMRVVVINTMCSFMMVSQSYCEKQLQTLFTVLENIKDDVIRSNIVYYIGDYSCRYPNLLEGWVGYLYGRLKDESALVRRSAVVVLSELIFHDIIKVKGNLYLMGLALVDEEERVRDLAHTFFHEYSSKTNAIYNVLPDLISSLGKEDIERKQFEYIIKFIFSFIAKDKQHEQLMAKLLQRFTLNEQTPKQWGCTAYCLSLLNYNEKSLKKLIESAKMFGNKLHVKEVKEAFMNMCNRLRKFVKPEMKPLVEEFEKIVVREGGNEKEDEEELERERNETDQSKMEEDSE
ncbi:condensin, putative [Entamoeba invadens IP1]|uniref:Condensin, putative n=1 Tax=Entamoeba invadens IP1 TaxID=370355 RepID=L7FKQ3_ENTIV|nr:condensin, putative [Entamoeba invadens IP1]ELP84879.1 condensin, putative [Entamoeba invadens IP1]|eukprot:XP_004184225.1 condensin, putative [Entamoeba invadens IP1]